MPNQPLVSIVLNVYNGADYLAACIRSVLAQRYQNFEFIIVDDASSDNTLEVIRSFDDPRIRCIARKERRHICYTINEGLAQAKGEWIAHIDHDDVWTPDKLEKQVAYVLAHPNVGACFSQVDLIDGEGRVINDRFPDIHRMFCTGYATRKEWVRRFFYEGNCLSYSSSLLRRDLAVEQNLFCRQLHDFEMWCRILPKTDFYVYPEALVGQRWVIAPTKSSLSSRENDVRMENELYLILRATLLDGLSDGQVMDYFREDFLCADSATELELAVERTFLLLGSSLTDSRATVPGLRALEGLLKRPGAVELLEEKYHLSLPQLYGYTSQEVCYTRLTQRDGQERDELRLQLEQERRRSQALERQCEEDRRQSEEHRQLWEETQRQLTGCQSALEKTKRELETYQQEYALALAQRDGCAGHAQRLEQDIRAIQASYSWRLTAPMRAVTTRLRKMPHVVLVVRGLRHLRRYGVRSAWARVKAHRAQVRRRKAALAWEKKWRADQGALVPPPAFGVTQEEYEAQRGKKFPRDIKFSILVPLYNTPEQLLREMIASVQHQTYENWELCLADGSDAGHGDVGRICRELAARDGRIKYRRLEKNLGISGNTNACIDLATGEYIGLFDHDDLLHPSALYENMEAICGQGADFLYTDENTFRETPRDAYCPHFKPDFAPDTLRSYNYICHFTVFSRGLMDQVGRFRPECDGSQDYDMILRLTERARKIVHIPKILYYWRAGANSTAADISAKPYIMGAAKRALGEHLERIGLKGTVSDSRVPSTYKIDYAIEPKPLVSILIPSCDHWMTLKRCVDSIRDKTTYPNWELVIVENNSKDPKTFAYYDTLADDPRIQVVRWEGKFNYSAINNFGFQYTKGQLVLLLNNDISVITPQWLEEMVMYAQRSDVGAVGAMLYYPSDKVQHAGVVLGIGGVAGHAHKYFPRGDYGYMSRMAIAQNYSACTAACLMVPRRVYEQVQGLDESFEVAFNDVDLCMRIRQAGYLIVWTPYAELYHYESESRGAEDTPEKVKRFNGEIARFQARWGEALAAGDPYYNPNFTLDREDFSIRDEALL